MRDTRDTAGTGLLFFLLGVAVGSVVVALTTPKTGNELRADLKDMASRVRDKTRRAGQDLRAGAEEAAEEMTTG